MIDICECKKVFFDYIKNYDMSDSKINLKVIHTLKVLNTALYISQKLKLDEENKNLSLLIALLHDIGRFEQVNQYSTFSDKRSFDHADYGVKILFEDGLIRQFIATEKYDNIIYKAIKNHNKYKIEDGLSKEELMHAKIIRDADKLDNFRIQYTEEMRTLLDMSEIEIGKQIISKEIYNDFMQNKLVNTKNAKNQIDIFISWIACIFDINYSVSFNYLMENEYIDKLFSRIDYTNNITINQIAILKENVKEYINNITNEKLLLLGEKF